MKLFHLDIPPKSPFGKGGLVTRQRLAPLRFLFVFYVFTLFVISYFFSVAKWHSLTLFAEWQRMAFARYSR